MTIREAQPLFDTYVIVDWSAANQPKRGSDSIWICCRGPTGAERIENPRTRHKARLLLRDLLVDAVAHGGRALVGLDFPFGYPAGFAKRLGLSGLPWRAIWKEISELIDDNEENKNNRFDVASILNERISGGRFPFWGCPAKRTYGFLSPKHHRLHESDGLRQRRLVARLAGAPSLAAAERRRVEPEEAWRLGVRARRARPKGPSPAMGEREGPPRKAGEDEASSNGDPHPASADASATLSRGAGEG